MAWVSARKQQRGRVSGECFSVVLQEPGLLSGLILQVLWFWQSRSQLPVKGREEQAGPAPSEHDAEPTMGGFTYFAGGLACFRPPLR